jgi:hypothetical protein
MYCRPIGENRHQEEFSLNRLCFSRFPCREASFLKKDAFLVAFLSNNPYFRTRTVKLRVPISSESQATQVADYLNPTDNET